MMRKLASMSLAEIVARVGYTLVVEESPSAGQDDAPTGTDTMQQKPLSKSMRRKLASMSLAGVLRRAASMLEEETSSASGSAASDEAC